MNMQRPLPQQIFGAVLMIAAIVLAGWLSQRHSLKIDWTANKRNTLSEASRNQLAALSEPLRFVAFSYPGAEERAFVEYQVEKYRRFYPATELSWIDPSADPQAVRDYGISFAGQVVVEYQGRREVLGQLNEYEITAALQRLSFGVETWVLFVDGHGERALTDPSTQSFSRLANLLREKGIKARSINLVANPVIPDNTAAVVIASPTAALFPGEARLLADYVAGGGNLLWLADPDHPPGIEALSTALGVEWLDGFAIFPDYELIGTGHPGIFAALDYPANPVTRDFHQLSLFPFVRGVRANASTEWTVSPLLSTSDSAWLETGPLDQGSVGFDAAEDLGGPLDIGLSLSRRLSPPAATSAPEAAAAPAAAAKQQRVVLIGDADFLSDGFIAQAGNQQLGLNIIQWITQRDSQLNIDVPRARDLELNLPAWGLSLITGGFVLLLPLLLVGIGLSRWLVRRRR